MREMNSKVRRLTFKDYREIAHAFLKNVGIDKNSRFPLELDLLIDKAGYRIEAITHLKQDFGVKGAIEFLCHLSDPEYRMMEQQARNVGSNILLPPFLFDPYVLDFCRQHEMEIKKERFYDKWDVADYLADSISKNINISKQPVFYSILKRYPEPLLIDRIIETIGTDI